jgi:hypothetical protein
VLLVEHFLLHLLLFSKIQKPRFKKQTEFIRHTGAVGAGAPLAPPDAIIGTS